MLLLISAFKIFNVIEWKKNYKKKYFQIIYFIPHYKPAKLGVLIFPKGIIVNVNSRVFSGSKSLSL